MRAFRDDARASLNRPIENELSGSNVDTACDFLSNRIGCNIVLGGSVDCERPPCCDVDVLRNIRQTLDESLEFGEIGVCIYLGTTPFYPICLWPVRCCGYLVHGRVYLGPA